MGAAVITNKVQGVRNKQKIVECDVAFSASYATGGDTVALASLGLKKVEEINVPSHHLITRKPVATASTQTGLSLALGGTSVAPKVLAYDSASTEVVNATNISARGPIRVRFIGF